MLLPGSAAAGDARPAGLSPVTGAISGLRMWVGTTLRSCRLQRWRSFQLLLLRQPGSPVLQKTGLMRPQLQFRSSQHRKDLSERVQRKP